MSAAPVDGKTTRSRRRVTKVLAIEIIGLLILPLVLGVVLGWFDLNPKQAEALSSIGSSAHDLLNSFPDDSLMIEVDYQASAGPPPASSLTTLELRVNETCAKGSVSIQEYPFTSSATTFSESSLFSLEEAAQHTWSSPGTVVLDYLYLNGGDADNANVIGLAYHGTSVAVFASAISAIAPGSQGVAVTTTVLVHEFGHELGLVGIVGAAPNEDPNHPYHSSNPNDVMYWAVDTTSILGGLFGAGPPNQFDAADLADLSTVKSTTILTEVLPWIVLGTTVGAALLLAWLETRARR
jgi:hypothetical protein